ncbi:hypothetical protein [Candidatus Tisiphia endosymbiont of Myopa tessellatipennis]|uniref:hypothetical protein n=1 Tax=Candidatus Tisiphia endosymbiont of Myopa tessellatipennis TaxID=3066257 RepID=UPI00313EC1E4
MNYQILALTIGVFSLIIGQILLILLSVKWLNQIRSTCSDIKVICNSFSNVYIKAQDEISALYQKTTELANSTAKKENYILNSTFQLADINLHLKILLDEFKVFANSSNTTSQTKTQK